MWQDTKQLVIEIYRITEKFPTAEKFGLVSQLQRAGVSVTANISEGSARNTSKDQTYFFNMAFASLMEVLNLVIIAQELGYLEYDKYLEIRLLIDKTANKLNAVKNKISPEK